MACSRRCTMTGGRCRGCVRRRGARARRRRTRLLRCSSVRRGRSRARRIATARVARTRTRALLCMRSQALPRPRRMHALRLPTRSSSRRRRLFRTLRLAACTPFGRRIRDSLFPIFHRRLSSLVRHSRDKREQNKQDERREASHKDGAPRSLGFPAPPLHPHKYPGVRPGRGCHASTARRLPYESPAIAKSRSEEASQKSSAALQNVGGPTSDIWRRVS